jgi:hypothetical protein
MYLSAKYTGIQWQTIQYTEKTCVAGKTVALQSYIVKR